MPPEGLLAGQPHRADGLGIRAPARRRERDASLTTVHAPANLTDDDLLGRIKAGDPEAFGELYDRYSTPALRMARMICGDSCEAEDAVQETFISVWRSCATYQPGRGSPRTWLMGIAHNRAVDVARRQGKHASRRSSEEQLASVPSSTDIAQDAVTHAQAAHLSVALSRLPEIQREAIVLAFFGQLTHAEIAGQLALPEGTVKGRIRLGLTRLSYELRDERQIA